MLARELLNKPDGFILASDSDREREYIIESIKRESTHKNIDDSSMYWLLQLRDGGSGFIKK